MKQLLPIGLLCVALSAFSQTFPTQDAIWQTVYYSIIGPNPIWEVQCRDTLINGQAYTKVYNYTETQNGSSTSTSYAGAVRAEGQQVWAVFYGQTEETILFDYSLQKGDSTDLHISFNDTVTLYVDSIWVEDYGGQGRKLLRMQYPFANSFGDELWFKGLGGTRGLFQRGYAYIDAMASLLCIQVGDDIAYALGGDQGVCHFPVHWDDIVSSTENRRISDLRVYPNPSSGLLTLSLPDAKGDYQVELFNLNGQSCYAAQLPAFDPPMACLFRLSRFGLCTASGTGFENGEHSAADHAVPRRNDPRPS